MLVVTLTMGCSVAFRTRTRITVSVTSGRTSVLVRISTQDFSKKKENIINASLPQITGSL